MYYYSLSVKHIASSPSLYLSPIIITCPVAPPSASVWLVIIGDGASLLLACVVLGVAWFFASYTRDAALRKK